MTRTEQKSVKLTPFAKQCLKNDNPQLFAFYMSITNNDNPGYSAAHKERQQRTSEVMTIMRCAEIAISTQKPSPKSIITGRSEKNTLPATVFYLNKEILQSQDQSKTRVTLSRSTGFILSPGIKALVYNSLSTPIQISKNVEMTSNFMLVRYAKELYAGLPHESVQDSIVICEDDAAAVKIFNTTTKKNGQKKYIGDAVWDKSITQTDIRYIPANRIGAECLSVIARFTQQEILRTFLSKAELDAAADIKTGDGIVKGLVCYEFISCNVSKLARAKQQHKDMSKVGFICRKSQVQFIRDFLGLQHINARVFTDEQVKQIFEQKGATQ